MLYTAIPKETNNAELKIKQYKHHLDDKERTFIANQIITQKVKSSTWLLKQLSNFYDIDFKTIENETKLYDSVSINDIMVYEGRIASAYWSVLSRIFNQLASDFRFETKKTYLIPGI